MESAVVEAMGRPSSRITSLAVAPWCFQRMRMTSDSTRVRMGDSRRFMMCGIFSTKITVVKTARPPVAHRAPPPAPRRPRSAALLRIADGPQRSDDLFFRGLDLAQHFVAVGTHADGVRHVVGFPAGVVDAVEGLAQALAPRSADHPEIR